MIVVCLGMPRSGSTWLFNVVRELVEAAEGGVESFEATSLTAVDSLLVGKSRAIVIRCHTLTDAMLRLMLAAGVQFVLSTRDPRDCVASLCAQLGGRSSGWSTEVSRSLATVATVQQETGASVFAFEDHFIDDPETPFALVRYLGLALPDEAVRRVASSWTKEFVQARIEAVSDNEPTEYGFRSDPVTGLNESHVGDGRIGKWRDVVPAWEASMLDRAFGQCSAPQFGPRSGDVLRFSEPLFGMAAVPVGIVRFTSNSTTLGERLIALCYLSTGHWRISLRGTMPPRLYPYWLRVVSGRRICFERLVEASTSDPTTISAEFDFEQVHLHQMEVLVESWFSTLPDPFRLNSLELEAVRS